MGDFYQQPKANNTRAELASTVEISPVNLVDLRSSISNAPQASQRGMVSLLLPDGPPEAVEKFISLHGEHASCLAKGSGFSARRSNQDGLLYFRGNSADIHFSIDGMGGERRGQEACITVAQSIAASLVEIDKNGTEIDFSIVFADAGKALEKRYQQLQQLERQEEERGTKASLEDAHKEHSKTMGVCLVGVAIQSKGESGRYDAQFNHLGDSRAIVLRSGRTAFSTKDHSLVQVLIDNDLLAPSEAKHHVKSHIVTESLSVLGGRNISKDPEVSNFELESNDIVILASDGLWANFDNSEVAALVGEKTEPLEIVQHLRVAVARAVLCDNGKDDNLNIRAILVR